MRLSEIAAAIPDARRCDDGGTGATQAPAPEITGLAYDSRRAGAGTLFFCVSGFRTDGHAFAPAALEQGAAALVVERPLSLGVPELLVRSVRAAMAPAAARFHGDPATELMVVGVTGTNGKTTTAYLVRELLEACGIQCGLLGTVKSVIGGVEHEVARTTPEAIDLQADLRAMLDGGDRACAIEVSSHALELGRAGAIPFAAAVFTNLTQDHLDFHPTMEDYFAAKRRLFFPQDGTPAPRASIVNAGDEYGARLAGELPDAITFAVEGEAAYSARSLSCGFSGCEFTLGTPEGERRVALPMPGRFNVANALGALAAARSLGPPLQELLRALQRGVRVPGRFEPVSEGQGFAVIVDYAHTPDSLENVLLAARDLAAQRRVICVFGAGGDRDRGKRPMMGAIGARLSDVLFVTSDNPRSEEPEAIVEEIMEGVRDCGGAAEVHAVVDRREAIHEAVAAASDGDIVMIAGKGHEQGQEFADGVKLPFDDVSVAREALAGGGRPAGAGAGR